MAMQLLTIEEGHATDWANPVLGFGERHVAGG
jgi:hypothetical protein